MVEQKSTLWRLHLIIITNIHIIIKEELVFSDHLTDLIMKVFDKAN